LLAIAQILEPDSDKSTVQKGIDGLGALTPVDDSMKFRIVKNQAVGYLLLGDPSKAFSSLAAEWKTNKAGSVAAAENLGRFRVPKGMRSIEELRQAQSTLKGWLEATPKRSPAYNTVFEGYSLICDELNEKPGEIKEMPTFLQPAVSIIHKGKESGVLVGLDKFVAAYGKAQLLVPILKEYDDLFRLVWEDGAFSLVCEEFKALRVTSYVAGDYFTIKAADNTVTNDYVVKVGDAVSDVTWFNLKGGYEREILGRNGLETWHMFPGLNFGVLIEKDKIVGITVSKYAPVEEGEG